MNEEREPHRVSEGEREEASAEIRLPSLLLLLSLLPKRLLLCMRRETQAVTVAAAGAALPREAERPDSELLSLSLSLRERREKRLQRHSRR